MTEDYRTRLIGHRYFISKYEIVNKRTNAMLPHKLRRGHNTAATV